MEGTIMARPQHLFKLYESEQLPLESGYILTANFDEGESIYSTFEIISYQNVKEIVSDGSILTFRSDGYKQYILVEPPNYLNRSTEPVFRETGKTIPYRFKEVEIFTDYRNNRIMVGKKPIVSISSFSVDNPEGESFSLFIFKDEEVETVLKNIITDILNKDLGIPRTEARQAASLATKNIIDAVQF